VENKIWYFIVDEKQYGPLAPLAIQNLLKNGRVNENTLVWCQGMENWAPLRNINELMSLVSQSFPPPVPPVILEKPISSHVQQSVTPQYESQLAKPSGIM